MKYFGKFPRTVWDIDTNNKYKLVVNIFKTLIIKDSIKNDENLFFEYYMNDGDSAEIIADKIYGSPEYHWIVFMMNDVVNPHYDMLLDSNKLEKYINGKYPGTALYITKISPINFKVGETITCNGSDTTVNAWDASYKRLVIPSDMPQYVVGETVTSASGASGEITRHDTYYKYSLHHIEVDGIYKSPIVNINDVYDTTDYLAQYMGGGDDEKFITNADYEIGINEGKRKIKLLKSKFLGTILEHFESLIG